MKDKGAPARPTSRGFATAESILALPRETKRLIGWDAHLAIFRPSVDPCQETSPSLAIASGLRENWPICRGKVAMYAHEAPRRRLEGTSQERQRPAGGRAEACCTGT